MRKVMFSIILTAIVFFFAGFFLQLSLKGKGERVSITRFAHNSLTNPLLDCEIYNDDPSTKVNSLKRKVSNLVQDRPRSVDSVSVYYRDLNNGPTFGINENDKFAPASLLKVPLMIAYLKKTETDPTLLSQKISYSGSHQLKENLPKSETLTMGENYTVDDLLFRMIALSDNLAFETLLNRINISDVKTTHKDLDIIYPDQETPDDYITVKSYAGLFRVLFNATYLSRPMSEKALKYLTKSDFHFGIQAGIPKNVTSALKFGLREINDEGFIQIHDCGIVYHEKSPYLLCIMTKGNDKNELVKIISRISKYIYDNVGQ